MGQGTVTITAATITDTDINASANIAASKQKHQGDARTTFGLDYDATPTAQTRTLHVATGSETLRGVRFMLHDTGTSTDIDFDLLVNDSSVLDAVVNFVHGDADGTVKTGTITSASLTAGDRVTVDVAITSSTGAQGPFAELYFDRNYVSS